METRASQAAKPSPTDSRARAKWAGMALLVLLAAARARVAPGPGISQQPAFDHPSIQSGPHVRGKPNRFTASTAA